MIVSINQPAYLPWLGYFHRIGVSDLHIVLDHVQFEKNSFTNRNKVRQKLGSYWLTVPVRTKGKFGDLPINRLEIDSKVFWGKKHWASLQLSYGKAPYFAAHRPFFEGIYARAWDYLADLAAESNAYQLKALDIDTPVVFSSEMGVGGVKDELVLNLCLEVGATQYLSGPLGRQYLNENSFAEAGIELVYHDYAHPVYSQIHSGFEPYMATIDLLFNLGPKAGEVLRVD